MRELHPSAQGVLSRVLAAKEEFDWFAEFGAVAELDRLARAMDGRQGRELAEHLDTPIRVGNVTFYRLSWAAADWYDDCALAWWRDQPFLLAKALGWAHAHARDPQAIREASASRTRAKVIVLYWAAGVAAPFMAVDAAVRALLPQTAARTGDRKSGDGRSLLAYLTTRTGLPQEHWLYKVSFDHVCDCLRELSESSLDDQAQVAAMLGKKIESAAESYYGIAWLAFREAAKVFLERHGVPWDRKKTGQQDEAEAAAPAGETGE